MKHCIILIFSLILLCTGTKSIFAVQLQLSEQTTGDTLVTALRLAYDDGVFLPVLGIKHWVNNKFAWSGHLYLFQSTKGNYVEFSIFSQFEFHWLSREKVQNNVSPFFSIGLSAGFEKSWSWFVAPSISIGTEIFLAHGLSLSLEQGLDFTFLFRDNLGSNPDFQPMLQLSRVGKNRVTLHFYF